MQKIEISRRLKSPKRLKRKFIIGIFQSKMVFLITQALMVFIVHRSAVFVNKPMGVQQDPLTYLLIYNNYAVLK